MAPDDRIYIFAGDLVGTGDEGEPLVMPRMGCPRPRPIPFRQFDAAMELRWSASAKERLQRQDRLDRKRRAESLRPS